MHRGLTIVAAGGHDPLPALEAAATLVGRDSADVLAIAVLEPLPVHGLSEELMLLPPSFDADRAASMHDTLEALVSRVAGDESMWATRVIHGEPSRAIAGLATDHAASLVIMGIGHHRPVDRLVGAETTLRTMRHVECPMLAAAPGLGERPRTVVAAVDFSEACAHALQVALPLLAPRARIHLVHVWQPVASHEGAAAAQAQYRASLPDRFDAFAARLLVPSGVELLREIREGRPAPSILAFADEVNADLIVAGRHGRGLLERLMIGSVTTGLLRGTTRSLFVAHGTG